MKLHPLMDFIGGPLVAGWSAILAIAERVRPLRRPLEQRWRRLAINGAMAGIAVVVVRGAVVPVMIAAAHHAKRRGFGLVRLLPVGPVGRAIATLLLLDYTMYLWHRMNHRVPTLWRFHEVHHTDGDLDVTTSFRFHFGELVASVGFRAAQVWLVGAAPATVLVYEVCMQAATAFHHSDLRLPERLERALNLLVVTPRMHTIHHSVEPRELGSNWSVILSVWDRLHGTFSPPFPERPVTIGVRSAPEPGALLLGDLLRRPFQRRSDP